jgi:hypothetical protein
MKYYAVFFAGDELPSALFLTIEDANEVAASAPDWCDRDVQSMSIPRRFLKKKTRRKPGIK